MKFIADFHIHSHFSIATSKKLIPEYLDYWARLKGIRVVGTGDFTHPGWLKELKEKLEPSEQGLFRLKDTYRNNLTLTTPFITDAEVRFILTAEVSCIYKKKDKVRKVHNVIFAPDFTTVEKMQQAITKIGGNITSDGRPILGLDSRDLLEIALEASENIFFVPAHIWTPWFSALGAKSGFDTIEECYDDLSDHISAVETGLSSDPSMNWLCSFLDRYTLISNSDAHSPEKLGREANIFNTELSYDSITTTLKVGNPNHFLGTLEFFPQEGKYHYDGHRKCGILWDPVETLRHNSICPVCNKRVTVGVMNRVVQLSDRENALERKNRHPFYSLVPLKEILSEILGVGPSSGKVNNTYMEILQKTGSEFDILLNLPVEDIKSAGYGTLAEAVTRMRNREVFIKEGFDGEYGQIKVFQKHERNLFGSQESLFEKPVQKKDSEKQKRKMINFDLEEYRRLEKDQIQQEQSFSKAAEPVSSYDDSDTLNGLNPEQRAAAEHLTGPALVLAGPGTGKTHVLTCRIGELIKNKGVPPENILAVTFTNKAAKEMKERIHTLLKNKTIIDKLYISTFHAFGFSVLKKHCDRLGRNEHFSITDEDDKRHILLQQMACKKESVKQISAAITETKQNLKSSLALEDPLFAEQFTQYEDILQKQNAFDLDDLIYQTDNLFKRHPDIGAHYKESFQWIMIDEYQDINRAQYRMIKILAPDTSANLFAIGDPNQAIYGFRGADVAYINTFMDDYPEATIYTLKKSYRCSNHILKASGQVIMDDKSDSSFLEGLNEGVKITISPQNSDKSEAEFIARTIEEMIGGLRFFSMDSQITEGNRRSEITSLSDFAVLCRIRGQMNALEKAFHDHSIPFQTVGDTPFFKQEPVKSIVNFLKLSINPENRILKDSLITKTTVTPSKLTELIDTVKSQKSIQKKIETVINTCFSNQDSTKNLIVKELLDFSSEYKNNLEQFILSTDLGSGADIYKSNIEVVTLMTLHAAKGLEFPCVFIAGCEDGLLPYALVENQISDYNEEKRLLYVGMTRAQKFLFLTHAKKRFVFGKEYTLPRSPFLNSIEQELIEVAQREYKRKEKEEDLQLSLF